MAVVPLRYTVAIPVLEEDTLIAPSPFLVIVNDVVEPIPLIVPL